MSGQVIKFFNTIHGANTCHKGNSLKVSKADASLEGGEFYLFSIKYKLNILPLKAVRAKTDFW